MKNKAITPLENMQAFTHKLQKEDNRNKRLTKSMQWVLWVLAIMYVAIFNFDTHLTWHDRIGGIFYGIAFASFALIMRKLHKEYNTVDYGQPTNEMLKQAARRYKLFQKKLLWIIIPVIFMDVAMILVTYKHTANNIVKTILQTQALLLPALGSGLLIGILIWRKRQKPLRDKALTMLQELES
jgi:Ca2+/Na+ antiporter